MKHWKKMTALLALSLFLAACAGGPDVRPYEATGYMTEDEEVRFGHYVDAEVTHQFLVLDRKDITGAVNEIGQSLAKVSHRPELKYTFKVLNSSQVNAFAGPGGYLYVTTGLLAELGSRDELAAVLAHEIGHVNGRHVVRALRSARIAGGFLTVLSILAALGGAVVGVPAAGDLAQATAYIVTMIAYQGYSRAYESQADRLAIQYMMKAGYNPKAIVTVFEKFIKLRDEEGKKESLVILASHPALKDRIDEARKYISELERREIPDEGKSE